VTITAGTRLSRYEIRAQLGAGGMGEVYLALDTELDRKVAIKILPADVAANQDRMRRFAQEAKAAAALNHPNIAHIYEVGNADGVNFIAMEFVDGETLRDKIHGKNNDLKILLRYLLQVAEGLAKAHAGGIVHRDLKPDNIMITRDGHAKILDFGLAKLIEVAGQTPVYERDLGSGEIATVIMPVQHSIPGVVMGTVGYMSPEQAQAKSVDQRSDIFSFGCILYEAATGRKPFVGDSIIDTLHKIIHEPAPSITDLNPSASPDLQRIIRKCLAKEPEKRYQTIRDTANDLEELIEEMKGVSDPERSVAPPANVTSSGPQIVGGKSTDDDVRAAEGTVSISQPPASSAEYIVSGIKQHKLGAVIGLLVLIGSAVGLGLYLHARNTQVAIDSIAVLPFENQNRDPDTEYLSDGLTESIINSLTQLPSLRVSPRSSVFQYKGKDIDPLKAARDLGVRAVLTGRMLQRGDNLMVSVELLDVRDNKQLWGEQYNRKVADALAVQQEISREISERLRTKLSSEEQRQLTRRDTSNPEAYGFYLKGRYYWNKRTADNIRKAIEQFQQAADKDPNYALPYVGLADCYSILEVYLGTPASETLPKARAFAERALQLDNSLAEAHASLGYTYDGLWQWENAEGEFKRALGLNPSYPTAHHWYSLLLLDKGQFDEALTEARRAQELDPLSLVIGQNVAQACLARADVNSSIEQARKVIDLDPRYSRGHSQLGLAYLKQGNYSEAIVELQKAVDLPSERDRFSSSSLGYAYGVTGRRAEALAILKELEAKYERHEVLGQDLAAIYAGLGDKDQAFAWIEKDFQAHSGLLARTRWQLPFESLRSDARFADLLRRMGLPR